MIYFTSDLHFSHTNIMKYSPDTRGHFTSIEEMNSAIIEGWNSVVSDTDEVWILGDVTFDKTGDQARSHISQLKGIKHLVLGNHDSVVKKHCLDHFKSVQDYKMLSITDAKVPGGKWNFVLCHYPIISWDRRHHGAIHCHGHCHGTLKLPNNWQTNMFDVGIDNIAWDFKPVSSVDLISHWVNPKYLKVPDHHETKEPR